jgi:hypothetical protein
MSSRGLLHEPSGEAWAGAAHPIQQPLLQCRVVEGQIHGDEAQWMTLNLNGRIDIRFDAWMQQQAGAIASRSR